MANQLPSPPPGFFPEPPEGFVPEGPLSWSSMVGGIEQNLLPSAIQFGKDLINPILHPIETGAALKNLAKGVSQKLVPGEQPEEKYADAFGQFFMEPYGGWENAKRTLTRDPVGFAADLSMVLTGGGAAAARLPGVVRPADEPLPAVSEPSAPIERGDRTPIDIQREDETRFRRRLDYPSLGTF